MAKRSYTPMFIALAGTLLTAALFAQPQMALESGPATGTLGKVAEIEVPAGFTFVPTSSMRQFNEATGNLHNPEDVGAMFPDRDEDSWTAFFAFESVGYVKDDDKGELDAGAMMKSFRENDGPANAERKKHGYPELVTSGWSTKPFYDPATNNLTWGLQLRSGADNIINHQIRLLGRTGVMSVILVCDPASLESSVDEFATLLAGFEYIDGQKYSEFKSGDKIAKYGLTGLVLGGAAMAAIKGGLLAKLGKFGKLIIIALIAGVAALGKFFKNIFGGRRAAA